MKKWAWPGAKAPTLEELSAILDFMGRELATTRTPPPVHADVPDFAYARADFDASAWKTVRVVTETLNEHGQVVSTNTTDTKTTLVDIDDARMIVYSEFAARRASA